MDSRSIFLHHRSGVSTEGVTQTGRSTAPLAERGHVRRRDGRQIRHPHTLRAVGSRRNGDEQTDPMLPGKASRECWTVPVPQTDTGRLGENPKARERTLVKELGKLAP